MARSLRPALALLLSLGLAACGGGGGGDSGSAGGSGSGGGAPTGPGDTENLQPMAIGDLWLYDTVEQRWTGGSSGWQTDAFVYKVSVTGSQLVNGINTLVHEFQNLNSGDPASLAYATKDGAGLNVHFSGGSVASLQVLRFPLEQGDTYQAYQSPVTSLPYDYDGDGINESYVTRIVVSVGGLETVTVPAGTFSSARVVTTTRTETLTYSAGGETTTVSLQTQEWMVPDVGTVQLYKEENVGAGPVYTLRRLRAYIIDGERSDTTPPEAASTSPSLAGTSNAWSTVDIQFSEEVDYTALGNASFELRDALGQPVSGTVEIGPWHASFIPAAPLPTGTYTATVHDIPDLLGNVLPSHSWLFTVDTAQPGDPENLLPLAVGNAWVYTVTETTDFPWSSQTYQRFETISGTSTIAGHTAFARRSLDPVSRMTFSIANLVKTDIALLEVHAPGLAPPGMPESWVRLRFPFQQTCFYRSLSRENVDSGLDLDADGINETVTVVVQACANETASVTVPAGSFANARKSTISIQRTFTRSSDGSTISGDSSTSEWMVPGIGVVKRIQTTSTSTQVYELTAWKVGATASDTTPPTVTTTQPATTATQRLPVISGQFNESVDIARVGELEFTIVDGNGAPGSGTVVLGSKQVGFTPAAPLADGTYTITVRNVYDLLGNKLPQQSWTFKVDATPPHVVSTTPANGATGISNLTPGITVTFNEALNGFAAGGGVSTPLTISGLDSYSYGYSFNGATMNIGTQLLKHGTTYTVTLDHLLDQAGSKMTAPYSFSFTTLPGRLQDVRTQFLLTYSDVTASAIGDVNDDGRKDFVMVTGRSTILTNVDIFTMYIFLQNADGTLATPLKTVTYEPPSFSSSCYATGIGIGDVTGDGKTDIVLGEAGCGIKIFERQADGSWPRPPVIASTSAGRLRLADMNGDGLLDAVGLGNSNVNTSSLAVWYQQAGGGFGAETTYSLSFGYATPYTYGTVFDLGDVTGDGRIDAVFKKYSSFGSALVVLPQSASGGFDAPVNYGFANSPHALAVADLNNDGRKDIAFSMSTYPSGQEIGVLLQKADGSLASASHTGTNQHAYTLHAADFDNDGRTDLIAGTDNTLGLNLQKSDGTLAAEDRYSGGDMLAVGDLNGDGFPDVVTEAYGRVYIQYNTGP